MKYENAGTDFTCENRPDAWLLVLNSIRLGAMSPHVITLSSLVTYFATVFLGRFKGGGFVFGLSRSSCRAEGSSY